MSVSIRFIKLSGIMLIVYDVLGSVSSGTRLKICVGGGGSFSWAAWGLSHLGVRLTTCTRQ